MPPTSSRHATIVGGGKLSFAYWDGKAHVFDRGSDAHNALGAAEGGHKAIATNGGEEMLQWRENPRPARPVGHAAPDDRFGREGLRSMPVRRSLPLSKVYGLLEPGPVVLVATAAKGRVNLMTMSWHTMLDFEPPLVGCVISDRNFSFGLLKASRQCVIGIPTVALSDQVVGCGNTSGRSVDKFSRFGLTPVSASQVDAPLIAECYANLECRVADTRMVNKYDFFVLQVVKAWIDHTQKDPRTLHHRGWGSFMVAGDTIRLPSKMR
jgi:flavin reductase (DIM6/NTAB) family NADH-FMN oxidoreductase RutF